MTGQHTVIGGVGAYQGRNPASSRSAQDRFQTLRGNHHAVQLDPGTPAALELAPLAGRRTEHRQPPETGPTDHRHPTCPPTEGTAR
jgi:hypothetical protein